MAEYQPDLNALGYQSGTMKAIWDNIRGLDLLESLPFVRKGEFGATGHSLGGHNAIYTAVFDPRLQVVVSSCGFDSFLDYYDGDPANWQPGHGWCQTRYMSRLTDYRRRLAEIPFDFHELIGALAPRPVFVNAPLRDANFCWQSVDEVLKEVHGRYMGGTWEVYGRYVGGTWEVRGRYVGGTWEVYGGYMRGTCDVQARVMRQCSNRHGRHRIPKPVSICPLCSQLHTFLARYSPRWAMGSVPARRVTALARCSWLADGLPIKQEGRPNSEPPFTNPQPRVPQPILIRQPGPECIQTWRPLVCMKAAHHRAVPHQGLKLTR
jgi:hypothetical protein